MEKCICGGGTIITGEHTSICGFFCECSFCHMTSQHGNSREIAIENWDYMVKMIKAGEGSFGRESPVRKPVGCGTIGNNQPFVVCDDGTCWYEYHSKWENAPPIPGTAADMVKK